jgi:YD repeat-containing protein
MCSKRLLLSALILSAMVGTAASAVVNMKDSAYSDSMTDMIVPGVGYDLRIMRTYNSRSIYSGIFGFGMCTDFETKIEVTPESYIQATECGGGLQVTYTPKKADPDKISTTIKNIMTEVRARNKSKSPKFFADLEKELHENALLRDELGRQLKLKGKVELGAVFYANGRENETIVLKGTEYVRTLADGTFQKFNLDGRMTAMYDRNNNYLKLDWRGEELMSVTDNNGRKLNFKYSPSIKKAIEVAGPNGLRSTYAYKGEDLVQVVNAWKNKFLYAYDDGHNMTRTDFPDHTFKLMTYNKDKDWITSFRNRKGCLETYNYEMDKEDPTNHYTAMVVKKCGKEITNQSSFEFFHKNRLDLTGKYLYRIRSEVNGDLTDITFHEIFGKPLVYTHNKETTIYTYYDDGLVHSKKEKARWLEFEYKNKCRKVSSVEAKYFEPNKKEPAKTLRTLFSYEEVKCNLVSARNSDGIFVHLEYDPRGRIAKIEDQSKKVVLIKYEERFGKPVTVSRPGLGTIRVSYKSDGEIQRVDSKEGPSVAVQVASIFNNMLDMLAPAQAEANL